jgi:hypothetical protein
MSVCGVSIRFEVVRGAERGLSQMRGGFECFVCCDVCLKRRTDFGDGDRDVSTCFVHCFNFLHLRLAVSRRFSEGPSRGKSAEEHAPGRTRAQSTVGMDNGQAQRTFFYPVLPSATLLRPSSNLVRGKRVVSWGLSMRLRAKPSSNASLAKLDPSTEVEMQTKLHHVSSCGIATMPSSL